MMSTLGIHPLVHYGATNQYNEERDRHARALSDVASEWLSTGDSHRRHRRRPPLSPATRYERASGARATGSDGCQGRVRSAAPASAALALPPSSSRPAAPLLPRHTKESASRAQRGRLSTNIHRETSSTRTPRVHHRCCRVERFARTLHTESVLHSSVHRQRESFTASTRT